VETVPSAGDGLNLPEALAATLDPVFYLALEAARQAFQAGVTKDLDRNRVGVILGNIALPTENASALARACLGPTFAEKFGGREPPAAVDVSPLYGTSLPAAVIARALGLGGGSFTLDAACASSLFALKLAADELRAGRTDAVLAGGVSRPDCLYTQMGFSQLRALSPRGMCRPFDAGADGLVVGEGAGIFLLKRLEDALRDGDHILALIAGAGLSNDVGGGLLAPGGDGQLRAMREAYSQVGWSPADVDLIECHATGTPVGDAVEFRSLRALWADDPMRREKCVIGSVKSTTGHLLTAAGAAAVAKVLCALRAETLPPTANFRRPLPGLEIDESPFQVLSLPRPWPRRGDNVPRRAAVSGFGFGGVNAHLLLEEWRGPSRVARSAPRQTPITSHSAVNAEAGYEEPTQPRQFAHPGRGPSVQSGDGREIKVPIAVVAMEACVGPWRSVGAFQERVCGGCQPVAPRPPDNWWGVGGSEWFRRQRLRPEVFAGYYLESPLTIAADRFRIPPREVSEMLPQQLLILQVAAAALGNVPMPENLRPRTGVFLGLGIDLGTTNFHLRWSLLRQFPGDERVKNLVDSILPALTANRTMGALGSIAASRIAREFRLGGPAFTLCGETASGLRALELAVRALRLGEIDQALVGAVDLVGDVRSVLAAHSRRPYAPDATPRPFDASARGPIPGEGAAAVVLKRLDDALAQGDTVFAVIRGVGSAGGETSEAAFGEALRRAYEEAAIDPDSVDFLETHGSADPAEDRAEARALAGFFGKRTSAMPLHLSSVKADVGHTGAASGLASFIKACLCLDRQVLPPLRNISLPRSELVDAANAIATPSNPQIWLRDRSAGPRRAGVNSYAPEGGCVHVILEALERDPTAKRPEHVQPLGLPAEALFAVEGNETSELVAGLDRLRELGIGWQGNDVDALARAWLAKHPPRLEAKYAVALVARDGKELAQIIKAAVDSLQRDPSRALPEEADLPMSLRDRIFYCPRPLGSAGQLAFVFPGSGNTFTGMGRDLALRWPEVVRRQDAENDHLRSQFVPESFWTCSLTAGIRERLFAQVAVGSLVTDLLAQFGVRPSAALGYSLGESAMLFALRAWTDRDGMLARMRQSTLFVSDLAGLCNAARRSWQLPPDAKVEWSAGIVDRPADVVRAACATVPRAYLLIINSPSECVLGGQRQSVEAVANKLGCGFVGVSDPTTVHCPVAAAVADEYRQLHYLPVTPPPGIRFYSAALGRPCNLDSESVAQVILAQALQTVDFPSVVEAAYRDGVRLFVEVGPGASCSRMISRILGDRPHCACSACAPGADGVSMMLRLLGRLIAHRVPCDRSALYPLRLDQADSPQSRGPVVEVPIGGKDFRVEVRREPQQTPIRLSCEDQSCREETSASLEASVLTSQIARTADVRQSAAEAQSAYLRFAGALTSSVADNLAFQTTLLDALLARGAGVEQCADHPHSLVLDRAQCLEFAVGSIGKVLGRDFATIDSHPTRVRLPDEPLMLVDRILSVEGQPRSLGSGRVITEHNLLEGAWYLDGKRIPTCIAVEAGQADLFLSAYLGIDFETRGLAVYRLLDATVTFYRGLPGPGTTIRYDIHIDQFFRQGQTHLFRFRFEATVAGEPLLTMEAGCAGFFTPAELAAGKGVVQTALDRNPRPGVRASGEEKLAPQSVGSLNEDQVEALRRGDLGAAFGATFAGLVLTPTLRLPQGRMHLVDRVREIDPHGGRFGIGCIRAEADVHPDDWFLTCHFVDDRVMPGTLMYECCLHTLRIFLLRLGWLATQGEVVSEPVPGVASRLKCRGQATAATRVVTYEVTLNERGYRPEPYAIADALMYADGKPIVEITNMSVRLTGLTRQLVESLWESQGSLLRSPQGTEGTGEWRAMSSFAPMGEKSWVTGECAEQAASPLTPNPSPPRRGRGEPEGPAPLNAGRGEQACPSAHESGDGAEKTCAFPHERILAFAIGKPSEAFGEPYRIFDEGRVIARLPGPPFQFLDRIVRVEGEPWRMVPGGTAHAEYDVPPKAWYFAAERQALMPFSVLLEVALQPCGWLAAYVGSALTSSEDLSFRNLGGEGVLHALVGPDAGILATRARLTRVASSAGMILQHYDFEVRSRAGTVYSGTTSFGFFTKTALAQQVGIREAKLYQPDEKEQSRGETYTYPCHPPLPDDPLRMVDRVDLFVPGGGPSGLGFIEGSKAVNPKEWFFKAHFYQDPVWPGSLGLESFLQLLKEVARRSWGCGPRTRFNWATGARHRWLYRGQVTPGNRRARVQAIVSTREDHPQGGSLTADGWLEVDDRVIYRMNNFSVIADCSEGRT
jgi:acyl transferase domain-containing protein/3-hydroxymyristoyl/3-hydroxydecanoyl-(acyl carrier protein) dehydratase